MRARVPQLSRRGKLFDTIGHHNIASVHAAENLRQITRLLAQHYIADGHGLIRLNDIDKIRIRPAWIAAAGTSTTFFSVSVSSRGNAQLVREKLTFRVRKRRLQTDRAGGQAHLIFHRRDRARCKLLRQAKIKRIDREPDAAAGLVKSFEHIILGKC